MDVTCFSWRSWLMTDSKILRTLFFYYYYYICSYLFFFFLRNNYNMLLIPQLKPFFSRSSSILCIERCQFRYKVFGIYVHTYCSVGQCFISLLTNVRLNLNYKLVYFFFFFLLYFITVPQKTINKLFPNKNVCFSIKNIP